MADIERVKNAGINTIKGGGFIFSFCIPPYGTVQDHGRRSVVPWSASSKGLRMCTSKRLAAIKGISDAKVEKMKEAARKLDGHEFVTGFEYAEQRKELSKNAGLWFSDPNFGTYGGDIRLEFIFDTEKGNFSN